MAENHPVELPQGTRIRKRCSAQLPLTPVQYERLQRLAAERETTVAELLRAAARHAGLLDDHQQESP